MNASSIWMACTQAWGRLGLVGALGLGLLGLAAWTQWAWLPGQQAEVAQMASQARGLRHSLLDDGSASATSAHADITQPEQAWQAVWMALPRNDRRMAMQSAVLQGARARGLQLPNVQYQGQREAWARQGGDTLWRQRMLMPVQGTHAAVKDWIHGLLREPALSVDALNIQRDSASSDAVVAQVGVSLWWRQPVEGQP